MSPASAHQLVVVTTEFHPQRSGPAVLTAEMAAAATRAGWKTEVWAPALPTGKNERTWPFAVRRLDLDGSTGWRNQWRLARHLRRPKQEWDSTILYVSEPGALPALLLLQFFDLLPAARIHLTLHGSEILDLSSRPLIHWSARRLLARVERISVVSRYAQRLLTDVYPVTAGKVVVTPGALRSTFQQVPAPTPKTDSDCVIVLTVAQLHPKKGQLHVLDALTALPSPVRARLEYWLIGPSGDAAYEAKLHANAAECGFPVKFLGDVSDDQLSAIYAQADIFAMTSMVHELNVEGFGFVYLEAGAHGLPVVGHDIGGVPDAVLDGETGLLVPPDQPAALTATLGRLINEPALRRQLGDAGRARAFAPNWDNAAAILFGQPGPVPPPVL